MKLLICNKKNKQKGVALAFALMTALLLMTLSTTVVGLSMRHSRSGLESDFSQEALCAADWYVNAALDYMKQPNAYTITQKYSAYQNPYTDTVVLKKSSDDDMPSSALGNAAIAPIVLETNGKEKEYGLDNPGHVIRFKDTNSYPLVYFPQPGAAPASTYSLNDNFAVCDVAVEKVEPQSDLYKTKVTPGYYHLVVHSRVYDSSMWSQVSAVHNGTSVGISEYPTEGLLATRVIDVKARIEGPLDYLHIIQDGRSWRAQGLNLDGGDNSLFKSFIAGNQNALKNGLQICGFPQGYVENGRLRIDGGTYMSYQNQKKLGAVKRAYIDGSASFFNTTDSGYATFKDELTQKYPISTMKCSDTNPNGKNESNVLGVCKGGINVGSSAEYGQDSIGLPQSGENANYNTDSNSTDYGKRIYKKYADRQTYQSYVQEEIADTPGYTSNVLKKNRYTKDYDNPYFIDGTVGKNVYVGSLPSDKNNPNYVPDVYAPTPSSSAMPSDIRPCFAKIVVELGENDQIKISKVNEKAGRSKVLYNGKASGINNGVIAVKGGNVEVKSEIYTTASGNHKKGEAKQFTGEITIVADVENTREDSLNYGGIAKTDTKAKTINDNNNTSIYSSAAREFLDKHPQEFYDMAKKYPDDVSSPYDLKPIYPPYKVQDLVDRGMSDKVLEKAIADGHGDAYVWPMPTSEAVEREGNVYITSDIACGQTSNGRRGAVGIIAKNYVTLNDKTVATKDSADPAKQTLNIEAMLFSFDKSVQFDWTNDANNPNFEILKTNADKRQFNLTGCVVSSNLDIEGSEEGMGYLIQKELSNVSINNVPPYIPAYSEGKGRWVIISYTDTGVRNWF